LKIGTAIKQARTLRGITQSELSQRAKLSITYISEIENEKKDPSMQALRSIATAIGLDAPMILLLAMQDSDVSEEHRTAFNALRNQVIKKLRLTQE
jgi:transcriptional regulator with XRE-family HTH domain